jgi:phosphate transport system protein
MSETKDHTIHDIMISFREMASLILNQLTLLEKMRESTSEADLNEIAALMEENENRIDNYEVVIGEEFANAIALPHTMAHDIHRLVAIYRMTLNLERISDCIMNLTKIVSEIHLSSEYISVTPLIGEMLASGTVMVEKAILSFINADPDFAIWTIRNDSVVDEMNRKLLTGHLRKTDLDSRTHDMVLNYLELKEMISNIERIADHATNIAEASIYALQGTDVRHTGFGKEQGDKKN